MKVVPVADCWLEASQTWDLGLRRNLFDREIPRWVLFAEKLECGAVRSWERQIVVEGREQWDFLS